MLCRFGRVTTIWYNPLYETHMHCRLVVVCVWHECHVQHPETYTYKKTRCLCMILWWHIDHCSCSRSSSYLSTHCNTFPTHHTLLILLQAVFTFFHRWRTDWKAAISRKTEVALGAMLQEVAHSGFHCQMGGVLTFSTEYILAKGLIK
jgi:hypothetical protein